MYTSALRAHLGSHTHGAAGGRSWAWLLWEFLRTAGWCPGAAKWDIKWMKCSRRGGEQGHNNSLWGCSTLRGKEMQFYRGNGKKKSRLIPGSWQSWAAPPSLQRCLGNQGDDRWSWSEEGQQSFYKNCICGSRRCSEAGKRGRNR